MEVDKKTRTYFERRRSGMRKERSSFDTHWIELGENIQPRRTRFFVQDRNKGDRRHTAIINSRGTQAHRIATAGMLSGIMSPARPWFNLATFDPDMMEFMPVKLWLQTIERRMRAIFNGSNLYNMAPLMLGDTILFGTGNMFHVDDVNKVGRFYTNTVGSYYIAQNDRYEVDTMMRELEGTCTQLIAQFGMNEVSQQVKDAYDRGDYEKGFAYYHIIEPNPEFDPNSNLARHFMYRSVNYELSDAGEANILNYGGFKEFPVYCPRWSLALGDVYGTDCPGMVALGDVKGLQIEEKRRAQLLDKLVDPPLQGGPGFDNVPLDTWPGGANIATVTGDTLKPVYQVNPYFDELQRDIERHERRIEEAFFVDLFLAISNMEGIQPKNQLELSQRNEERLLMLGPVLENFHNEFLNNLIDRTFNQMNEIGLVPDAPPELQGQPLKVEYISSLAQAQRAVAAGSIERLVGFIQALAATDEQAMDKLDTDQTIDEYAAVIGSPPRAVRSDDAVQAMREQRAQQVAQQQAMEQMQQVANVAKTAADAKTDGGNVLTEIAEEVAGE